MNGDFLARLHRRSTIFERLQGHRFNVLLGLLVLLYLSMPVIQVLFPGPNHDTARVVIAIFFVALLLAVILAISKSPTVTRITLCLALPYIALDVATVIFSDWTTVEILQHVVNIVFLAFTSLVILGYVFSDEKITLNTISASLCVYFLIGLLWAVVFSLLTLIDPNSFNFGFENGAANASQMRFGSGESINPIYFSLVTLTTLGYGDITPATSTARTLAAFEAVMGQIYLAVLVARLVGLHTSQSFRNRFGVDENDCK